MDVFDYIEKLPRTTIIKYEKEPLRDSVPFTGFMRQHPAEHNKLILVSDPLGENPRILEFKFDDVVRAEDVAQAVTENGEGVPQIRLWIRRGAPGMILEPFEVNEPLP